MVLGSDTTADVDECLATTAFAASYSFTIIPNLVKASYRKLMVAFHFRDFLERTLSATEKCL
jgi:hypothetical protein